MEINLEEFKRIYASRNEELEEYKLHRKIIIIDIKSFYASVECCLRGLDPFKTPLVVADKERGGGSVVLSVSPYLKTFGVKNVCRIFDLPKDLDIIYATPRMSKYVEYSKNIVKIYLRYVSTEDIHIYSVDESFLDLTNYMVYYKKTIQEIASEIQGVIKSELGLFSTCGIGDNMLLAKLALDIESKKSPNFQAVWTYEDIPTKLWTITDLTKMWSIGFAMNRNLQAIGVRCIGDIATKQTPDSMHHYFGIIGEEMWYHVNGIDMSLLQEKERLGHSNAKSLGNSQVLFRDYYGDEIKVIIYEMVELVCKRLRMGNYITKTVMLGIAYSKNTPGGFGRQYSFLTHTDSLSTIYSAITRLFNENYDGSPIRRVGISFGNLIKKNEKRSISLFEEEDFSNKENQLNTILDQIKIKHGNISIFKGSSLLKESTFKARNKMIGGHRADEE